MAASRKRFTLYKTLTNAFPNKLFDGVSLEKNELEQLIKCLEIKGESYRHMRVLPMGRYNCQGIQSNI